MLFKDSGERTAINAKRSVVCRIGCPFNGVDVGTGVREIEHMKRQRQKNGFATADRKINLASIQFDPVSKQPNCTTRSAPSVGIICRDEIALEVNGNEPKRRRWRKHHTVDLLKDLFGLNILSALRNGELFARINLLCANSSCQ